MQHEQADGQPRCVACNGRWKYVSPRRGLVVARAGEPVERLRVREVFGVCGRRCGSIGGLTSRAAGPVITLPERLRAEHVEFARQMAEQAVAYAGEVERVYRNGAARKAVA